MPKTKKILTVVHTVLFADTIMNYFEEVIEGVASDLAYFELLLGAELYLEKPNKNFEKLLEFTFNIEKSDLRKIKKLYKEELKKVRTYKLF